MGENTYSAKVMNKAELVESAKQIRADVVQMIYYGKSGHPGGSLSRITSYNVCYTKLLREMWLYPDSCPNSSFLLSE